MKKYCAGMRGKNERPEYSEMLRIIVCGHFQGNASIHCRFRRLITAFVLARTQWQLHSFALVQNGAIHQCSAEERVFQRVGTPDINDNRLVRVTSNEYEKEIEIRIRRVLAYARSYGFLFAFHNAVWIAAH